LSCVIDNTRGKEPVKNFYITFEEHRYMIVDENQTKHLIDKCYYLVISNKSIPEGGGMTFNYNCKIPNDIISYTAIGSIVARYFILRLSIRYACCANTP